MTINEDSATVKLLRDYQDSKRRVASLTHALNCKIENIRQLLDHFDRDEVDWSPQGFRVPMEIVIEQKIIPVAEVSTEQLHEDLAQLSKAKTTHKRIGDCVRSAGFPDFTP